MNTTVSTAAVALETVVGIASPVVNNGTGKRRVYLHNISIAPRAADFAADVQIYLQKEYSGTNLVTNGTFASDTGWSKGTDWTITGGVAVKVVNGATALSQTIATPVIGDIYKLTYTLVETATGITPSFAGDSAPADAGSGTHAPVLVAATNAQTLAFTADATAIVTIDNVTLYKYGSTVSPWMHDTIRNGVNVPHHIEFSTKQPYSTDGWSLYCTTAGAATILDINITYEIV